jgi:hypothetical protein
MALGLGWLLMGVGVGRLSREIQRMADVAASLSVVHVICRIDNTYGIRFITPVK